MATTTRGAYRKSQPTPHSGIAQGRGNLLTNGPTFNVPISVSDWPTFQSVCLALNGSIARIVEAGDRQYESFNSAGAGGISTETVAPVGTVTTPTRRPRRKMSQATKDKIRAKLLAKRKGKVMTAGGNQ